MRPGEDNAERDAAPVGSGRALRVLQLVSSLSIGGAERLVLSLTEEAQGSRTHMHVGSVAPAGRSGLHSFFADLNVPMVHLDARNLADPRALLRLVLYLRRHRIDLVHTHLLYADVYGRLAARLAGIPSVSTLHNVPSDFSAEPAHRRVLETSTARHLARRIVTLSAGIGRAFIGAWGLSGSKVVVVPNAVRMGPWVGLPPADPSCPLTIITIGRLTEQKAQHLLLDAIGLLTPRWPNLRLVVVGDGPREADLKRRTRDLGIGRHVEFAGSRDDVPAVMARAHVFALSSAWEGMPISAIEAMAAGRAVVLTDVGANAELLRDGRDGLLVPPHDADALAHAIERLLADDGLRAALGRRARERARSEYGMPLFLERHEALYREVVAPPPGGARGGGRNSP